MTYNVFGGTLNPAQSNPLFTHYEDTKGSTKCRNWGSLLGGGS